MAAQPSAEVLAAMDTVRAVFVWVPVADNLAAAMCAHLGCAEGDPVRTLANTHEADVMAARSEIRVGERLLNAVEKGKVVASWKTARLAAKLDKPAGQVEKEKTEAAETAKTKVALLKEQLEVRKKSIANAVGQVSLAETLDQTLTGTIPMLPNAEIVAAHKVYEEVTEGECPEDERQ